MSDAPFPALLSHDAAWERLPPATHGQGAPLPAWARQLAGVLPLSTAALLELDYAQRALGPIPPRLRAAMRFVAASANGAEAAMRIARADFAREGGDLMPFEALRDGNFAGWDEPAQLALEFAHRMTVDSAGVTDEQFARSDIHTLRADFGDETTLILLLNACRYHYMTRISNGFQLTLERENVFFDYYNVKR